MTERTVSHTPIPDDVGPSLSLDPATETDDRSEVCLDGTLVLIGCGKAKRDPDDPADLHAASVGLGETMSNHPSADTGPAWRAADLYTSSYFAAKREFAEVVSRWTDKTAGWAILSAEHGILAPWEQVTPYDTTISDHGDDPTDPAHRVLNRFGRRRPDGQEIVTEMDQWAAQVSYGLMKWIPSHRPRRANPWENDANTLLVLAGQDYIEPLRAHCVFEYGISRMVGDPNQGFKQPLRVRYLFEEIDAGGIGAQMAWLSDAIDRLESGPERNRANGATTCNRVIARLLRRYRVMTEVEPDNPQPVTRIIANGGTDRDGRGQVFGRWAFQYNCAREWVERRLHGRVLNACAGRTKLAHPDDGAIVRNDLNSEIAADVHVDVATISDHFAPVSFDCVVFDPPFDDLQADDKYDDLRASDACAAHECFSESVRSGGSIIMFGWNSWGINSFAAFEREETVLFQREACLRDVIATVDRRTTACVMDGGR